MFTPEPEQPQQNKRISLLRRFKIKAAFGYEVISLIFPHECSTLTVQQKTACRISYIYCSLSKLMGTAFSFEPRGRLF